METISCAVTRDLLPLYVEGILSEETTAVVAAHLQSCEHCRREYEQMEACFVLPSAPALDEENRKVLKTMKRRLKHRRIRAAVIAALLTAAVCIAAFMAYTNVGAVYDYFTENTRVTLRDVHTENGWMPLTFEDGSQTLNFDRLICHKEVVVHADSTSGASFRIRDAEGAIVIDDLYVAPGAAASLDQLARNTDYTLEIKCYADFIAITFC